MKDVARASYAEHLEPYHSWLLRNTSGWGCRGCRSATTSSRMLALPFDDDEALLLEQMRGRERRSTRSRMRGL